MWLGVRVFIFNLVEKIRQRIGGWSSKFLNLSGKLVLVKSVLSSIPLHILTVLKIPVHVMDDIDHMLCDFLWGFKDGRKLHH